MLSLAQVLRLAFLCLHKQHHLAMYLMCKDATTAKPCSAPPSLRSSMGSAGNARTVRSKSRYSDFASGSAPLWLKNRLCALMSPSIPLLPVASQKAFPAIAKALSEQRFLFFRLYARCVRRVRRNCAAFGHVRMCAWMLVRFRSCPLRADSMPLVSHLACDGRYCALSSLRSHNVLLTLGWLHGRSGISAQWRSPQLLIGTTCSVSSRRCHRPAGPHFTHMVCGGYRSCRWSLACSSLLQVLPFRMEQSRQERCCRSTQNTRQRTGAPPRRLPRVINPRGRQGSGLWRTETVLWGFPRPVGA